MPYSDAVDSRVLLTRLRATLAEPGGGQERLDRIVRLVAEGLVAEVCSIYLRREDVLELSATEGLNPGSVHLSRLRVGQGLVGQIAETAEPLSTTDASHTRGYRYLPETGEEGLVELPRRADPAPRRGPGRPRGAEPRAARLYRRRDLRPRGRRHGHRRDGRARRLRRPRRAWRRRPHKLPFFVRGLVGQEGVAEGTVVLHEPQIVVSQPISDDPEHERLRLHAGIEALRAEVDEMLAADYLNASGEHRDVLNAYRMFAHDKGWVRRMEASIDLGLAAEVAVEKEQSATRTRMSRAADPYLRERLHDLDDLSNRLLRLLSGDQRNGLELPADAILVARNIGPGELLDYGRKLRGVVLEEGSVGSHAAIVARALAIPLVIQAARITREALNGDAILVDGDLGHVHLRPEETVAKAFREKMDMLHEAQAAYAALRDKPATTRDGVTLSLYMNAGLMADLPSLPKCGALGVGLFRTELQFLIRTTVPEARRARRALLPHPRLAPATSRWSSAPSTSARTRCCPT